MVKNVIKIVSMILMIIVIISLNQMPSYATGMSDVTENVNYWKPTEEPDDSELSNKISGITSGIRVVGILVSIGSLMVIGVKYMLGSLEEKAQYKQRMMPWIIGAIMVFAMTTIPTIIYDLSKELF